MSNTAPPPTGTRTDRTALEEALEAQRRASSAIERAALTPKTKPAPSAEPGRPLPILTLIHDHAADLHMLTEVRSAMEAALEGSDVTLAMHAIGAGDDARLLAKYLRRFTPVGVILTPPLSDMRGLAEACETAGVSCVMLGSADPAKRPFVDERGSMAALVSWMVSLGHSRIAFVAGPDDLASAQQRELGYLDAMAEHGLDRGPSLIAGGDDGLESGKAAGALLLELSPRPTAIIASNDAMAAGVLHAAAKEKIVVPAGLSVVGFGGGTQGEWTLPPLTTVAIPWRTMAREAVHQLAGMANPDAVFAAELVNRGSVRRLSGSSSSPRD